MKTERTFTIGNTRVYVHPAVLTQNGIGVIKIAWKATNLGERPDVPSLELLAPGYRCLAVDIFVHEDGRNIDGEHTFEAIPENVRS